MTRIAILGFGSLIEDPGGIVARNDSHRCLRPDAHFVAAAYHVCVGQHVAMLADTEAGTGPRQAGRAAHARHRLPRIATAAGVRTAPAAPLVRQPPRFQELRRGQQRGHRVPCGRRFIGTRGREVEPLVRLNEIARKAQAVEVHDAEIVPGLGLAPFGGHAKPACGLVVVLYDAKAVGVTHAKVERGSGMALFRGQTVPALRFTMVLGNAFALRMGDAEVVLSLGVALLRRQTVGCGSAAIRARSSAISSAVKSRP